MAVYVSKKLLGIDILKNEGIDIKVNNNLKDIRKIGIVNLMPNKDETEAQLLRLLSLTGEDIKVEFIRIENLNDNSTFYDYVLNTYETFREVREELDGVIITGAPVEKLEFSEVRYIDEIKEILDYIQENMKSSLYICWGAQVALNHFYNIKKLVRENKIFGVFSHEILKSDNIFTNIDSGFKCPHSRYTTLDKDDISKNEKIKVLAMSDENHFHILKGDFNEYYFLGHCEYEKNTLKNEYSRDILKGLEIDLPKNYFYKNNANNNIIFNWRDTAVELYKNWIKSI